MATGPDARLADLGLTLPDLRPRAGTYVGWRRFADLLFLAGQGADGWVGRVGDTLDLTQARAAARDCGLNLLAQTRAALGSLDAVDGIAKVTGFVACTPAFGHPTIPSRNYGMSCATNMVFILLMRQI
jgi:hypothetical protein